MLSAEERHELVRLATRSIHRRVEGKGEAHATENRSEQLCEPAGAFVTIYKGEELRGCLGLIYSDRPLYETVSEMAERTATEDPRFPPVTSDELPDLRIEVSVLSPLKEVTSIEEITVGIHGLFVVAGMFRGLLLPQVAAKHDWDRTVFLEETCTKAGLPRDQWKYPETKIYIFTAEVFGEEESDG